MANRVEYRTIVCRYGKDSEIILAQRYFGWEFSHKTLLNRFGNPLTTDAGIDEDDLREKCSWELHFVREVEESKIMELSRLQNEHDSILPLDNSFGKGRITGSVWLSIFSIACYIVGGYYLFTPGIALAITLMILGFILFGVPIIIIFTTGAGRVVRINKENEKRSKVRKEIVAKAKKLLSE